jgi:hypothetical protein
LTSGEDLDIHIEDLILNASMEDVLGGDTEDFTPSYNELKKFMLKVLLSLSFFITHLLPNVCISIWYKIFIKPSEICFVLAIGHLLCYCISESRLGSSLSLDICFVSVPNNDFRGEA